jgi:hypothetical protein
MGVEQEVPEKIMTRDTTKRVAQAMYG